MFRITLERLPLRVDFEAGSVAEAVAILQEQDTALRQIVSLADDMAGNTEQPTTGEATTEAPKVPKPRGRPAKNQPDPATATAPPPVAVPPAAAPPVAPVNTAPAVDGGIPPFLQRAPEVAAAPPPPPAPPAPPAAPVVPPSGILAGKVIAALDARKVSEEAGKSLVAWLAQCGLVTAGASYDEAVAVVRMTPDDKLTGIAGPQGLGVAA